MKRKEGKKNEEKWEKEREKENEKEKVYFRGKMLYNSYIHE